MRFSITALVFSLTAIASATDILLPLYLYPGNDAADWQPVYNALSSYLTVSFKIVIDPDSGPGGPTYPDTKLNSYKNALVLGYVHTSYVAQPLSAVQANITKYANWTTYAKTTGNKNITIGGIFFNEALSKNTGGNVQYMSDAADWAQAKLKSATNPSPEIVFNPGVLTDAAYFDNADLIIQFENAYSAYTSPGTINTFPAGKVEQSVVIAHDAPSTAGSTVKSYAKTAAGKDVGAIYFATDCCYAGIGLLGNIASGLV
ncbi:putative cell surface spherulin 4-like protein [Polychaeton citri CBS 116435]|uniref:Cell surface spherulin 4-like protein n=1 Tax=Polychaeton citri CBS 116435 TaxID=1314669 RepID=A0A9P4UJP9_9PEZI|nr:putative cell surface spherulin 4-like protein [Polychaeton citri CBS 116435]